MVTDTFVSVATARPPRGEVLTMPRLTPWVITSMWLSYDAQNGGAGGDGGGFEVCTWQDSYQDQLWAKFVVGHQGLRKSAWGYYPRYHALDAVTDF